MPWEVSAWPRVSVEGDGVKITGTATGGDSDNVCTHVGYALRGKEAAGGEPVTPAGSGYATVYPGPGNYTCFADFTGAGGGWHKESGDSFTVSAKPS